MNRRGFLSVLIGIPLMPRLVSLPAASLPTITIEPFIGRHVYQIDHDGVALLLKDLGEWMQENGIRLLAESNANPAGVAGLSGVNEFNPGFFEGGLNLDKV